MAIDDKHQPQDMAAHAQPDNARTRPSGQKRLFEDWLTVGVMAALAFITFGNVLVRYFTDASFAWTEEISTFLMIVLALVGGASAVVREAHIRIEFFADAGSSARRRRLAQAGALLVALLFIAIGVLSVPVVWDQYQYEETSPGIGVPQWWYSVWLPVFSALIAGRALQVFARKLRRDAAGVETAE
ncbi:MAG: TRAP transporter small permease [Gammaproteobacteria bacterium]